jgi:DNA-directed RNA polymerase specialized sigma24 family protein
MINEEEVCILKRKIDELNTRGKEALTLYGDGYSYKEIMKILSLPMYAIKSDIFRARTKLNQLL